MRELEPETRPVSDYLDQDGHQFARLQTQVGESIAHALLAPSAAYEREREIERLLSAAEAPDFDDAVAGVGPVPK